MPPGRCLCSWSLCWLLPWILACGGDPNGLAELTGSSSSTAAIDDVVPSCGNGVVELDEGCDLGVANEVGLQCTAQCQIPKCGDGLLSPAEECDDGAEVDGDGCSAQCQVEGLPRWSHTEDGEPRSEFLREVAQVGDSLVAVGTRFDNLLEVPLVVVVDAATGAHRWRRVVDFAPVEQGGATGVAIVQGDVIVAGVVGDDHNVRRPWLARYTPAGKLVYQRRFAVPDVDGLAAMAKLDAGRVRVVGNRLFGGPWTAQVDVADGVMTEVADIPSGVPLTGIADLARTPDGGWVMVGDPQGALAWVGRFDAQLNLQWERHWNQLPGAGMSVIADKDTVYIAGSIPRDEFETDIWLAALNDDEGSTRWEQEHAGAPQGWDRAHAMALHPQGGVWVVGSVSTQPLAASAPFDRDAWLRWYSAQGEVRQTLDFDGPLHGRDEAAAVLVDDAGHPVVAGSSEVLFENANPWLASFAPGRETVTRPALPTVDGDRSSAQARQPGAGALYLDFDGGTLRPGDWGPQGEFSCATTQAPYPGFSGTAAEAEAVVTRVRELLAPYDVRIYSETRPPQHLPYTTVMVGALPEQLGFPEQVKGFACVVDCTDRWSRDLVLSFDTESPFLMARHIVHEAAHAWGLDHVIDSGALMQPIAGFNETWGDSCVPISSETSTPSCVDANARWCPAGQQNSDAALRGTFGVRRPDTAPPVITIRAPTDGAEVAAGSPVPLDVEAADNRGEPGLRVSVEALGWARIGATSAMQGELALPPGQHVLSVDAVDQVGNETRQTVTVNVR